MTIALAAAAGLTSGGLLLAILAYCIRRRKINKPKEVPKEESVTLQDEDLNSLPKVELVLPTEVSTPETSDKLDTSSSCVIYVADNYGPHEVSREVAKADVHLPPAKDDVNGASKSCAPTSAIEVDRIRVEKTENGNLRNEFPTEEITASVHHQHIQPANDSVVSNECPN